MWKEGNSCALLAGMQIASATMKNKMEDPQLKIDLPYDSAISFLSVKRDICISMFIATLSTMPTYENNIPSKN